MCSSDPGSGFFSAILYTRLPQAWPHLVSYTSYRLECGIRSSAILGFVGLPTLGYYLESSFSQGYYPEVAGLMILFYLLIATKKVWLRRWTLPLFLLGAPFFMGTGLPIIWGNVGRFFSEDIVPAPLRSGEANWQSLADWAGTIVIDQALPGVWNTLLLSQIALVVTGLFALLFFPLINRYCFGVAGRFPGHVFLVIARSTPEYLLAYILLQLLGPSMLPAVIALAIHNGALIGYLTGRNSNEIQLRPDAPERQLDRYFYELLPRSYPAFLSFMLYRWEVIMRETAILGILGIQTIGFFVDSAIQEIRFDVALLLILVAAMMNAFLDTWVGRLGDLGEIETGFLSRERVVEEGADIADILLTPDQAVPLSLLLTEALTNAMKYAGGAREGAQPELEVTLTREAGTGAVLRLSNSLPVSG